MRTILIAASRGNDTVWVPAFIVARVALHRKYCLFIPLCNFHKKKAFK